MGCMSYTSEAVGSRFPRPEPQIPVHPFGDRLRRRLAAENLLIPTAGIGPGMDFTHIANRPIPDHLTGLADEVAGVALVPQLGRHAGLFRHPGHLARLPDVVGERLFAIDMFALAHRRYANIS